MKKLEDYVITIPDFPEPGIMFRDITGILQDAEGFQLAIDSLLALIGDTPCDVIAGAESRGFIFGAPLAYALKKPFALVRKNGRLAREAVCDYSIRPGQKVILIDDLIATGGTIEAAAKLVEQLGGEVVKIIFLMELAGLNGREKLSKYDVESVITYKGK